VNDTLEVWVNTAHVGCSTNSHIAIEQLFAIVSEHDVVVLIKQVIYSDGDCRPSTG